MRRLAWWITIREERDQWVPKRLWIWAFDYLMATGTPVTIAVGSRPRVVVAQAHPMIEVNPTPKTWATGTAITLRWPEDVV